jgi:hypothetical protein
MYVHGNPKTKKQLKEWVASGLRVELFAPGFGAPVRNGVETVEGPHYPAPHSWYAQVKMKDGVVVKVR